MFRRPSRPTGRSRVVVLAVLTALVLTGCEFPGRTPIAGVIDQRGDFETGDASQFSLECPNPDRQLSIVSSPVRQGRYAARFQTGPGDNWSNGSIRCLAADYDSDESQGDDYYYALSMYFPRLPSNTTVWELHNRSEIYSVDEDTSTAPHALVTDDGKLEYRLLTGPAAWDGGDWTGWSYYEPAIEVLPSIPVDRWIDVIVHIRFDHDDRGLLEIWSRTDGEQWTRDPQVRRERIPTLQWIPGTDNEVLGHPNDPAVPEDLMTRSLYVEMGLYPGVDEVSRTDVVFLDGYRRGTTLSSVLTEFR